MFRRIKRKIAGHFRCLASSCSWASPYWASFFYGVLDSSFAREQRAFLSGRSRFNSGFGGVCDSSSILRRAVHRIEKGLIARPRRSVFATDYILAAVEAYAEKLKDLKATGSAELAWAHDVFVEYFRVCGEDARVKEASSLFSGLPVVSFSTEDMRSDLRKPYGRGKVSTPIAYDDLLSLAKVRRSVRWFEDRTVPREKLLKAIAVATLSPSACNRQPFTFRIFDKEPMLSNAAGLPPGTRGYEHQFPCVIAVVGHQRYYSLERDRHLIYIDGSLATMSLILALETLGLSSCCINWPDIEERELAAEKTLKLESDERIVMFIAVGYADPEGLIPYSEKRTPEELCRFNFE